MSSTGRLMSVAVTASPLAHTATLVIVFSSVWLKLSSTVPLTRTRSPSWTLTPKSLSKT